MGSGLAEVRGLLSYRGYCSGGRGGRRSSQWLPERGKMHLKRCSGLISQSCVTVSELYPVSRETALPFSAMAGEVTLFPAGQLHDYGEKQLASLQIHMPITHQNCYSQQSCQQGELSVCLYVRHNQALRAIQASYFVQTVKSICTLQQHCCCC